MDKVITPPSPSHTTTSTHTHTYNTSLQPNKMPVRQRNSAFENTFAETYHDNGTAEGSKATP